jgi:hypothetical protein
LVWLGLGWNFLEILLKEPLSSFCNMETFCKEWLAKVAEAPYVLQVGLQGYLYGVCCWIQESQEENKWLDVPTLEECMEYSEDDLADFHNVEDSFGLDLKNLPSTPLPTESELADLLEQVSKEASEKIPKELFILKTLLEGDELSEEQKECMKAFLAQPPQPQEPLQPPQQLPSKPKKFHMTRRTHGRRAITPIKRRHGHRVSSRHRTRVASRKESKQTV